MKHRTRKIGNEWVIERRSWLWWRLTDVKFTGQLKAQEYVYEKNKEYGYEHR